MVEQIGWRLQWGCQAAPVQLTIRREGHQYVDLRAEPLAGGVTSGLPMVSTSNVIDKDLGRRS